MGKLRLIGRTLLCAAGASLVATTLATALPLGRSDKISEVREQLVSRTASGGAPNAPAYEPTISWDGRIGRYIAYSSSATNLTAGTNGRRNIFLVTRSGGGPSGTPWTYGSTTLASPGAGGQPANGDSSAPSLGGWTQGDLARRPKCLAFVSSASNLVSGDANNHADAFVRKLPGGGMKRIASPAGTSASGVAISGDCHTIAVVAGGSLYIKRGKHLKKHTSGGVSSPRLSYNGTGLSFAKGSSIYVGRTHGGARQVATGANPAPEGGEPGSQNGKIRSLAYQSGGSVYYKAIGGGTRQVGNGTAGHPSAGGGQVMFGSGPYVYLWALSNNFGKRLPQGYCPAGQGNVTAVQPSGRGNYIVFSCAGGRVYLAYLGGK